MSIGVRGQQWTERMTVFYIYYHNYCNELVCQVDQVVLKRPFFRKEEVNQIISEKLFNFKTYKGSKPQVALKQKFTFQFYDTP